MYHAASKRIHEHQNGLVTVECAKHPLAEEVAQQNHFNEQAYKLNPHNTSIVPTCIKTGNTAG